MSEQLITIDDIARRLRVVRRTVERKMAALKANGLQEVPTGSRMRRFTASSFDRILKRSIEREVPIIRDGIV